MLGAILRSKICCTQSRAGGNRSRSKLREKSAAGSCRSLPVRTHRRAAFDWLCVICESFETRVIHFSSLSLSAARCAAAHCRCMKPCKCREVVSRPRARGIQSLRRGVERTESCQPDLCCQCCQANKCSWVVLVIECVRRGTI
jgi:hypothetical protein